LELVRFDHSLDPHVYFQQQLYIYTRAREANNESSEVVDILLPVAFYFNHSTRLDNVKTTDDSLFAHGKHRLQYVL